MALLTEAELAGIEEVAELGMETPISVLQFIKVERPDYDDQEVWATTAITTAMLYSPTNVNPRPGIEGGVIGDPETLTALIRKAIDVSPGDQIGVDGELFRVTGSNEFDTYSPSKILALRRHE